MMIQKLKTQIGQIEAIISTVEPFLEENEFQDFCDNAYSCVSYLRQCIRKENHEYLLGKSLCDSCGLDYLTCNPDSRVEFVSESGIKVVRSCSKYLKHKIK